MRIWTAIFSLCLMGGSMMATAIEEPSWTLVGKLEAVELRHYTATIQARTPLAAQESGSSSFRRLAKYIFGGNDRDQSIAMTAPVEQTMAYMDDYMAFTMPAKHSMEELPAPLDDSVSLHRVPARTVAAIRFSGWATDGKVEEMTDTLLTTLREHAIEPLGPPSLNQYNPPWTLPWLRRNEIMVEIPEQS